MIALDTSAVIELIRHTSRGKTIIQDISAEECALPVFVVHELLLGHTEEFSRLEHLTVLPYFLPEARRSASLQTALKKKGISVGLVDIMIAAIVQERGMMLVTCDQDFKKIPGLSLKIY